MNRELVMLAHNFDPARHSVAGMMMSEKLDGMRALWLPETKGLSIEEIPFANRERDKREHVATGLWSRYGKIIHCPSTFTERLPPFPLDGELWIDRGRFQGLMSIVKELKPGFGWENVKYMVFDAPGHSAIYKPGVIKGVNYTYEFGHRTMDALLGKTVPANPGGFERVYYALKAMLMADDWGFKLHLQQMLPFQTQAAQHLLDLKMKEVKELGGEGIMLRNPSSVWEPIRTHSLVKLKPYQDSEATVEGWIEGKGKYKGMLGALIVKWGEVRFELSGMSDKERRDYLRIFPIGCCVTFRYRELSDGGIPKEARYLRIQVI